jgi:dUTP pyrophosphatase
MEPLTPTVRFVKTHEDAELPVANDNSALTGDTGYDLYAVEDLVIPSCNSAVVDVGLTLSYVDPGYWFRIEPRSGLGFNYSIQPHLGVIDNGYRGDLGVKLYNFYGQDYQVHAGDRIAQIVFYRLIQPIMEWSDDVEETDRGDSGFGSSGN